MMNNEMTTLIENIKEDYLNWTTRCAAANWGRVSGLGTLTETNKTMIAEFNEKITYKVGTKYIKVFTEGGSVWGFVVNTENDKKFRKGDILKAAGYAAPARNKARGNILDGGYTIEWTGPLYLQEIMMIRKPITPKNIIDLDGPDGNAFSLMAIAKGLARDVGYASDEKEIMLKKMMSGDYKNLVKTFDEYFGGYVVLETANEELL